MTGNIMSSTEVAQIRSYPYAISPLTAGRLADSHETLRARASKAYEELNETRKETTAASLDKAKQIVALLCERDRLRTENEQLRATILGNGAEIERRGRLLAAMRTDLSRTSDRAVAAEKKAAEASAEIARLQHNLRFSFDPSASQAKFMLDQANAELREIDKTLDVCALRKREGATRAEKIRFAVHQNAALDRRAHVAEAELALARVNTRTIRRRAIAEVGDALTRLYATS